jgi:peroxiredoxin
MKPSQIAQLAFILVASIAVYLFVTAAQDGEARAACTALCALRPAYANEDRRAPDFELPDLSGKPVRFSSYRGKTVILNFWTKTCRPCLEEMATLDELAHLLTEEHDIELLTINTDGTAEDAKQTLATVLGKEPRFRTLSDPESAVVGGKFGTRLYPETWFVDPSGVIRARVDGARDWSNPLVLDVARMVARSSGCAIRFEAGKVRGDRRDVCGDSGTMATQ